MKTKILLILILTIAAVVRLYNLGNIPPSLTPDEAAIGYNAYSILKTGRDEHGKLLPMVFESFGDYKPGLYIYATVPSVALLGLNEYSTRLPGAIFGILGIWAIYLVSLELFSSDQFSKNKEKIGLFAAFLLSVSPWHVLLSRGAWEVNMSLTLTLFGIYFFLKSFKKNSLLIVSSVFFGLTLLTYQGAKLSTLIVLALLLICYRNEFRKQKVNIVGTSCIVGFIISIPILISLFTGQAGRLSVFNIFSAKRSTDSIQNILNQDGENIGSLSYYLFHSESLSFLRGIIGRWSNHFSGQFLFFEGDFQNPRHSAPYSGMLLLSDAPFLILGLIVFFRKKFTSETAFTLLWLALASLPAILTRDQVHAVRAFNMEIPLIILISVGCVTFMNKFHKYFFAKILLLGIYFIGIVIFMDKYFVHLPAQNSKYWEYGYKQIVEAVSPIQNNYTKIIVQQSYAQPYIYFLFYQKYDPDKYQKQSVEDFKPSTIGDVGLVEKLDNITFDGIDWQHVRGEKGALVVGDPVHIPASDSPEGVEFHVVKEIQYLDKIHMAFRIVEIKK